MEEEKVELKEIGPQISPEKTVGANKLRSDAIETLPHPKNTKKIKSENHENEEFNFTKKVLILMIIILIGSGTYFDFDFLHVMMTPMFSFYHITPQNYLAVDSLNGLTSIFLAPVAGYFISVLGVRHSAIYFTGLLYLGLFIAYLSTIRYQFIFVQIGYLFVGIANDGVLNTQITGLQKWFFGRSLSFAVGMKFASYMLLGALSDFLCPTVFKRFRSLMAPFFMTAVVSFVGFAASLVYFWVEPRLLKPRNSKEEALKPSENGNISRKKNQNSVEIQEETNALIPSLASIHENRTESFHKPQNETIFHNFKFSDLKKLGTLYWLCAAVYCFLPQASSKLNHILVDLVKVKYGFSYQEAKNFPIFLKIASLACLPVFSFIVSKVGRKALLLCLSAVILLLSMLNLYLTRTKSPAMLLLSLSGVAVYYALFISCIWSSISISLPSAAVGLGLGIASSLQNVLNAVLPSALGRLTRDRTARAYEDGLLLLVVVNAGSLLVAIWLYVYDQRNGRVLALKENSVAVRKFRDLQNRRFRRRSK